MEKETLQEEAVRVKAEIAYEEKDCEKCGEEVGTKLIGDEIYYYCPKCNWTTH